MDGGAAAAAGATRAACAWGGGEGEGAAKKFARRAGTCAEDRPPAKDAASGLGATAVVMDALRAPMAASSADGPAGAGAGAGAGRNPDGEGAPRPPAAAAAAARCCAARNESMVRSTSSSSCCHAMSAADTKRGDGRDMGVGRGSSGDGPARGKIGPALG